jgi:Flp pilus assembly protein TadG
MQKRCIQYRARNVRGAALIEFAFALPVVLLMFFGMIEISRVLFLQHSVDTAAYEGARSAMVPGATSNDAKVAADALLKAAGLKSATITVTPDIITETTPLLTVRVEVPVGANSWGMPQWFKDKNIASEVTLVCERPPMVQLTGVPNLKSKGANLKGKQPTL